MGLYSILDPEEIGLPTSIEREIFRMFFSIEIDYGPALDAACEAFIDMATQLVPVDTGYLQSTIDAESDGLVSEFFADAEYAQYPEFGTWCQPAQPYFAPALQYAWQIFITGAKECYAEAQDLLNDEIQGAIDDGEFDEELMAIGGIGGAMSRAPITTAIAGSIVNTGMNWGMAVAGDSWLSIGLGAGAAILGLLLFFPLAVPLYAFERTIWDPIFGMPDEDHGAFSVDGCPLEIEIT